MHNDDNYGHDDDYDATVTVVDADVGGNWIYTTKTSIILVSRSLLKPYILSS